MVLNDHYIPVLSKKDIEEEAKKFLQLHYPQALIDPMVVPIEEIAELKMGLTIDYVNITEDKSILGMMIFSDGVTEIYKKETGEYVLEEVNKGTILVEEDLCDNNRGRERFTIAHEIVHWDKHQIRFKMMELFKGQHLLAMACRCSEKGPRKLITAEDWMEWQADSLAAAILMPQDTFKAKAKELIDTYGFIFPLTKFGDAISYEFENEIIVDYIIQELAETFQVSKLAAEIRLRNLGILV